MVKFICYVQYLKIIVSGFLLTLFACNSKVEPEEDSTQHKIETQNPNWEKKETNEYTFSYPKTWELVDDGSQGTAFIVVSKRIDSSDNFSESVNLVTQEVGEMSLDEYVSLSEQQIEEYMQESEVIGSRRKLIGKDSFHECLFKATDKGTRFVFEQKYAIKNGVAYILTYTAEDKTYLDMKPLADVVINSFKLK